MSAAHKSDDPRVAFGHAVRALREARKISQERLAEMADIARSYIGDVERGTRNVALLNMAKIAGALDVPLSRLIRDMEEHEATSSERKRK